MFGNQLAWFDAAVQVGSHIVQPRVTILRFEHFDDEVLPFLRHRVGLDVPSRAGRNHSSQRDSTCKYYDWSSVALVQQHYERDISAFDYRFPCTDECAWCRAPPGAGSTRNTRRSAIHSAAAGSTLPSGAAAAAEPAKKADKAAKKAAKAASEASLP